MHRRPASTFATIFSVISAAAVGILGAMIIVKAPLLIALLGGRIPYQTVLYSASSPSSDASLSATSSSEILSHEDVNEEGPGILPLSEQNAKPWTITAKQYFVAPLSYLPNATVLESVPADPVLKKDSERSVPIASLTKLVTAVVAEQLLNQNTEITITPHILSTYGNTAQFRLGEQFRVSELFYPLLLVSSNDAAEALAQAYTPLGGVDGRTRFIKAMNDWVYSIGAYHTYFADPSGLSPQNISSAEDLALIIRWIYNNDPDLIDITHLKVKSIRVHTWVNPTQFLNLSSYVGGKNGYLPEAALTGVSLFNVVVNGKHQIYEVIVLGSVNRDMDALALLRKVGIQI